MVVCDEAQYAKNPTTQRTCAVKALKSKHRAALTGTPVENGLIEFWCIMDFVQPGLLGSWADFRKEYERPIVQGENEERENKIKYLIGRIKGYYLRRLKEQALELPSKNIDIRNTGLSDQQFEIYREIAKSARAGGRGAKLAAIQKLLMLSAHPVTVKARDSIRDYESAECPKLKVTISILSEIRDLNEKAIIFTDFKIIQRVLQENIRKAFGIWPDIINGEITGNRQIIIDIFSEKQGFNVIILGHQVAGVGLNITAANHVIHYTRPWNPAKENQATDRVHRIGQEKEVTVYYPVVTDSRFVTVEQRLDELIRSKADLARDVLRPTHEFKVNPEDLLNCIENI
jgi:SNF2 family DNA or RNA helicase